MSEFSAVAAITARMVGASPADHPFVNEPMSVELHEAVARLLNEIGVALTAFAAWPGRSTPLSRRVRPHRMADSTHSVTVTL
ncbi:hypothetical protein ACIBF5_21125 [Micromonospora sp. NPDC050417]|uniref:hypothetical protein n=1 Tax=Micromonospora sp. NPDC050417 TaxID=3364280 RepID=UPI00378758BA